MRLIVIDGNDGCGKATQSLLLYRYLQAIGENVHYVSFPRYGTEHSSLVRSFLNNEFDETNPKVQSLFFALDRYAFFRTHTFPNDAILICDRYTTSNELYQSIYQSDPVSFLEWVADTEYNMLRIPKPDHLILLTLPGNIRNELLNKRSGKTAGQTGDIYENDKELLNKVDANYNLIASRYNSIIINCAENNSMRTEESISNDIINYVKEHVL